MFFSSVLTGMIYTAGSLDCEAQDSYWLTVYATDRGVVPLSASIEVFIQVEDVNDNAPLTSEPVYHPYVMENSPKDVSVVRVQAQDLDVTASENRLTYRITAGNPQNFFSIDYNTGTFFVLLKNKTKNTHNHSEIKDRIVKCITIEGKASLCIANKLILQFRLFPFKIMVIGLTVLVF